MIPLIVILLKNLDSPKNKINESNVINDNEDTFNFSNKKSKNKNIKIVKRYKSNELNPFAEKEMIKMVEENIYTEILNEIIREVSFFEM